MMFRPLLLAATKRPACPMRAAGAAGVGAGNNAYAKPPRPHPEFPAKCRMGFIPEEWFLFFHSKTGVTGPYVLMLVGANYLFSKEVYVMEHEYYLGLSLALVIYVITTKAGKKIGAALDKQVDAVVKQLNAEKKQEADYYESQIKEAKAAQLRAEGQKLLMDAKKENVLMQLEAVYRERCMMVYRNVRGRMDYHVRRRNAEARIHQRWMVDWVLSRVMKSIDANFEKRALEQAISDLSAAASRA